VQACRWTTGSSGTLAHWEATPAVGCIGLGASLTSYLRSGPAGADCQTAVRSPRPSSAIKLIFRPHNACKVE